MISLLNIRRTFDSVSHGIKEQRPRGVSDSSLDALNREAQRDSLKRDGNCNSLNRDGKCDSLKRDGNCDSLNRDIDSKKSNAMNRDSLKRRSLKHKFSQTEGDLLNKLFYYAICLVIIDNS